MCVALVTERTIGSLLIGGRSKRPCCAAEAILNQASREDREDGRLGGNFTLFVILILQPL